MVPGGPRELTERFATAAPDRALLGSRRLSGRPPEDGPDRLVREADLAGVLSQRGALPGKDGDQSNAIAVELATGSRTARGAARTTGCTARGRGRDRDRLAAVTR